MDVKITNTVEVDWELPKPMLYTVSWKNPDGETILNKHLSLNDVKDIITNIHNQNEYYSKPIITDVKIISEY